MPPCCYKDSGLIINLFFNKLDDVTNDEQDRTVKRKEQRITIPARSQEKKKGDSTELKIKVRLHLTLYSSKKTLLKSFSTYWSGKYKSCGCMHVFWILTYHKIAWFRFNCAWKTLSVEFLIVVSRQQNTLTKDTTCTSWL